MKAAAANAPYPWYDAWWLAEYARAKDVLARLHPERAAEFAARLRVLEARRDFSVVRLDQVLDGATFARIRQTTASLHPQQLELHEARTFGRFVVHNHPYFSELQRQLAPLVAAHAGEPVEPTYNFLSLYGPTGVCAPHLDAPSAKWTLDICIDQSAPWPIYFSQVVPWPEPGDGRGGGEDWAAAIKSAPDLRFEPVSLEPEQAVLFAGSSQWHYRDPMPSGRGRRFCDLLFFHYVPAGTRDLVRPERWTDLFGVPEVAGLGDPAQFIDV